MNTTEFCKSQGINISSNKVASNPNWTGAAADRADHWRVRLKVLGGGSFYTFFSKGSGHKGAAPEADEVLDSLALDANVLDQSFEEFCSDFGYDTDSRKAEQTWKACQKNAKRLHKFLGDELFRALTQEVERI